MNNEHITIYRDGRLSRWETIKPIVRDHLVTLGNYIDQVCVQSTFRPEL